MVVLKMSILNVGKLIMLVTHAAATAVTIRRLAVGALSLCLCTSVFKSVRSIRISNSSGYYSTQRHKDTKVT